MARLLAAQANGELQAALQGPVVDLDTVREALGKVVDREPAGSPGEMGTWLEAHVPALNGPHASRLWVKHVLREITRILPVA